MPNCSMGWLQARGVRTSFMPGGVLISLVVILVVAGPASSCRHQGQSSTATWRLHPAYPFSLITTDLFQSLLQDSPSGSPYTNGRSSFQKIPSIRHLNLRSPSQKLFRRSLRGMRQLASEDANMVILAPDRTNRMNPLKDFRNYGSGWDMVSKDYWASLAWSGSPGVIVGVVWVLGGLLFLGSLLCIYACCYARWRRVRKAKFEPNPVLTWIMLGLSACAMAVAIVGFVLLCVGQTRVWHLASSDMQYIVDTTDDVVGFVNRVADTLQGATNVTVGEFALSDAQQQQILDAAQQARTAANQVRSRVETTQKQASYFMNILSLLVIILASVFLLLLIFAAAAAVWKRPSLSYVAIGLVWLLCFFSLLMLTLSIDANNFVGDTEEALAQVEANPAAPSAMGYLIPCTNQSALNFTQVEMRRAIYELVSLVNLAWGTGELPPLVVGGRNVSQICNPFQGAPSYLPNTVPCAYAPTLDEVINNADASTCPKSVAALCTSPHGPIQRSELYMIVLTAALQRAYPDMGPIVNCRYVGEIATVLLTHVSAYNSATYLAWVGYLMLSAGAMVLALLMPYYVYRAVRTAEEGELSRIEQEKARKAALYGPSMSFKSNVVVLQSTPSGNGVTLGLPSSPTLSEKYNGVTEKSKMDI